MDETRSNNKDDQALAALMKAAQGGDAGAYQQLLNRISVLIKGYLLRRMAPGGVDDVLQEVLLSIHTARHTFDPEHPFLPWMYAITRYRLADFWRETFRRGRYEADEEMLLDQALPWSLEADHEVRHSVRAALGCLTEQQRKLIEKLKLEGMAIKDVAREMQMSEGAVKVAAHRAYKALRERLKKDFLWTQMN